MKSLSLLVVIFAIVSVLGQSKTPTKAEQEAAYAESRAKLEKLRKDPLHPLRLQGVGDAGLRAFSDAAPKRLIISAVKWLSTARDEYAPPDWDLDTTIIPDLRATPMTNAYFFAGSLSASNTTYFFETWCDQTVQFKDLHGIGYLTANSNRVALAKQRPKISQKEALEIATKGFEAAGLDASILHLGKPEVLRYKAAHHEKISKEVELPAYKVTWHDDAGGVVQVTVSGISKQIVEWGVSSKYVPRRTGDWYYDKLGVTNIPPADVGPLLR